MAYTRMSDIKFLKLEHREICIELYRDIMYIEAQLVADEASIEILRSSVGDAIANLIASNTIAFNKKLLTGLKIAFWYYTGKSASHIIDDLHIDDEQKIDIFNP